MTICSFAELRTILLDLGFTVRVVPDTAIIFEHAAARARLYLPPFADAEPVDPQNLAIVARNLDERGILSREQFEALLRQRSLVG